MVDNPPYRLRLAPATYEQKLMKENHAGSFGGHFATKGLCWLDTTGGTKCAVMYTTVVGVV